MKYFFLQFLEYALIAALRLQIQVTSASRFEETGH